MFFRFSNIIKLLVVTITIISGVFQPALAMTAVKTPVLVPTPTTLPAAGNAAVALPKAPNLSAKAAIIMDVTNGSVLYELNAQQRRSPASLTKMVSALVAYNQAKPTATVRISTNAASRPPTKLGLQTGDRISLDQLVQAMLIGSCNDAATAVAEHVSGSEAAFAKLMNKLAASIGAVDSNFVNPHGLDASGHYSTAYDLALIACHFLSKPELASIAAQTSTSLSWQGGKKEMANINSFLWRYDGAVGLKTGYTSKAGYSLAAAAKRSDQQLVVILLGCPSSEKRWTDAQVLMEYGMTNYTELSAAAALRQQVYVVKAGDTLSAIARKYNTSVNALLAANPKLKQDPNHLQVGQKVIIP